MEYLKTYLNKIASRGNEKLAESILKTSEDVGNRYIKTFSFSDHEIGLLFGNVQSGKTGQMFGIMCKAADLGFPAFVLLTTDNVVLQQQTLDRVRSDLDGFCICGENDAGLFTNNSLIQPAIIVLKKNVRVLKLWANILNSTGFMKGNPLFVIDDEADAASLNTLVNKDRQSSINRYLDIIKNGASSSLYLQVTGTPQAIFLQTIVSGWRPYFTYYFQPGDAYLPRHRKAAVRIIFRYNGASDKVSRCKTSCCLFTDSMCGRQSFKLPFSPKCPSICTQTICRRCVKGTRLVYC